MSPSEQQPTCVAFLGLGRMGAPMARHVLAAGHELVVWNRDPAKSQPFAEAGVAVAATPADAATKSEVVVLMLADPDAVRTVLCGPSGVVAGAAPGTLVIDASTIGPAAAKYMAARLRERGLRYVDAPVYGSVRPATDGTLGILAGGDAADVEAATPFLTLWGDPGKLVRVGEVGAGSAAKLVRNLTLGLSIAAIGEALRLGDALGLTAENVHEVVAASPLGGSFTGVRELIDAGRHGPASFSLAMLTKDLELCLDAMSEPAATESAPASGEAAHPQDRTKGLAMTAAASEAGRDAIAAGHGEDDCRALALHVAAR